MTQIKICGIRTLDEALAAVEAGADMLGFNFYPPSPRYITPERCAHLVADLRELASGVILTGVFVNVAPEEVRRIMALCGLDQAQLSGDEPPEHIAALGGRAFKAIRPARLSVAQLTAASYARRTPPVLLIDAAAGRAFGGSGQTANWEIAAALTDKMPILLAGGLKPDNVAAAIATVRPWGVDVASGVESAPGIKDAARVRAFVRAVREASV